MTVVVTHTTPADSSFSTEGAAAWNANHALSGVGTMAEQNANSVAITGGAIDGTTLGATTPAAATFTTLTANSTFQFGKGSANYGQGTGGATTKAVEFKALGSDTDVALALRSQGTGAIDLAAGSSGVNISNGGTVTALTVTAGSGYTSFPSVAITAPTTAGGVQATASVARMYAVGPTVVNGGTGYTLNDVVTLAGGTPLSVAATYTVTAVSGGVVTALAPVNYAVYTALPTNPCSTTGGTGTGLTINALWNLQTLTITNAGSGYVEQPTVTFSGGGGSGAAAYATVGSGTVVKSIGSTIDFSTPNGAGFRVVDSTQTSSNYWSALGGGNSVFRTVGAGQAYIDVSGLVPLSFRTAVSQEQFRVAHTASAVNYVQVTGAATANFPIISAQGSDTNVGLLFRTKGSPTGPGIRFENGSGAVLAAITASTSSPANYVRLDNAASGSSSGISAQGSDTNIDLALTPKGTGNVRFGTYTANMALTVQGYIEIKDSGGTVRKLAVIA